MRNRIRPALAAICMAATAQTPKTDGSPSTQSSAADKQVVERVCGSCHSTAMINDFRSEPDWKETVNNMIDTGATGSEDDFARVLRYLARNWTRIDINTASAAQFAAVLGVKESVAAAVVKYRVEHGPFRTIADLKKAPGMEQLKTEEYKDKLVVSLPGKEKP